MTRSDMRSMLRRRLHESDAVASALTTPQWTNAVLNDYLNMGLQWVHRQVIKIDPEAIIYTSHADITNAVSNYPRPANTQRTLYVYTRTTPTGSFGAAQDYIPYYKVAENDTNFSGWAIKGRFIVIFPTPTASVVGGLRLEFIPTLSMSVDTDVPDIVTDIHNAVVFRAEMYALGDAGVEATIAKEELSEIVAELPLYYKKTEQPQRYEQEITQWSQK